MHYSTKSETPKRTIKNIKPRKIKHTPNVKYIVFAKKTTSFSKKNTETTPNTTGSVKLDGMFRKNKKCRIHKLKIIRAINHSQIKKRPLFPIRSLSLKSMNIKQNKTKIAPTYTPKKSKVKKSIFNRKKRRA